MNTITAKVIAICSALVILFTSYPVMMVVLSNMFGREIISNNSVAIPLVIVSFVLALAIGMKIKRCLVKKAN